MTIHRHFGDLGLGNDAVDAGRVEAYALEQAIGSFDNVLPLFGGVGAEQHGKPYVIQTCLTYRSGDSFGQ
ncbi:hypothetical protein [Mesorhizobium sp.]|uniref:hypothetical protein n=1 Tax=Mesorhizobium sp. TaxID=1871066 RepID=UPI0025CC5A09|nr:hypothetical protein [Mesorhizobium sp.]